MMAVLDPETLAQAEQARLAQLSADSTEREVVLIEVVYRNQWARVDIDQLVLQHVPLEELVQRYLDPVFRAVGAPTTHPDAAVLQ